jgi:DNA repair protein RadD
LTTGYNNPMIDLIGNLRPMRSPVLYIQVGGRGMRTSPGKTDTLFLDFGGTVEALGPIDRISVPRKKSQGGAAPVRICPECQARNPTSVRLCRGCGHEFPAPQLNLTGTATDSAILSFREEPKELLVTRVLYHRHAKEGKPDSLRVEYLCGLSRHSEWVCLEHTGFPREQATRWWSKRMPGSRTPNTVAEALELSPSLPVPEAIKVKKNGKYLEIVDCVFETRAKAG